MAACGEDQNMGLGCVYVWLGMAPDYYYFFSRVGELHCVCVSCYALPCSALLFFSL